VHSSGGARQPAGRRAARGAAQLTLEVEARTGVFVLVFYVLKRPFSGYAEKPRMILVEITRKRSRSAKIAVHVDFFYKGRQRTNKARSQTKNGFITIFLS